MKQNIWLVAVLAFGIGLSLSSCEKNNETFEEAAEVTVGSEISNYGLETDMKSALIELPVRCDGEWTATLQKGTRWARILDWEVSYVGDHTLKIAVDENLTKYDRKTSIHLGNIDGEITEVTLSQYYNYEGQAPTNGSGQAFADKGLGTGIDYDYALNTKLNATRTEDFQPTKLHGLNNIFNLAVIQELQKRSSNPLKKSAYVEATIPIAELHAQMIDSTFIQDKTLGIGITLGVCFGPIEFTAHGSYQSKKTDSRTYVDYTIVRNCPMYNVYLSPSELATFASDPANNQMDISGDEAAWERVEQKEATYRKRNQRRGLTNLNENGLTDAQQQEIDAMYDAIPINYDYAGIFSADFTRRYNELYNAITTKNLQGIEPNKAEVDDILNALDNAYGPFFIAGGDYGGSLAMHCKVKKDFLEGDENFEGQLSAAFAGMFEVEGEFIYTSQGIENIRSFNPDIYIWGGNANETTDLMMETLFSDDITAMDNWQGILKGWISTMYSPEWDTPDQSQAAPISYSFTPIWTLFSEPDIQSACQEYFMEKYASRGIARYFGIMNGTEEAPGVDELINPDSAFNQSY